MYGKKRITITNKGNIVLAGKHKGEMGGSWIPIGRFYFNVHEQTYLAKYLLPEHRFEHQLNDQNSKTISVKKRTDIKNIVSAEYTNQLTPCQQKTEPL